MHSSAGRSSRAIGSLLVAVDGSESSLHAADLAIRLASDENAPLTFVHAVHWAPPVSSADFDLSGEIITTLRADGRELLDRALQRARAAGIACSGKIVEATPAAGILDSAKDAGVDMIVMGSHGHSGIARALLGSVAESVLRDSVIPVLVVPPWSK
jgi:nucleotide-binding universal stress UspA family protein